MRVFGDEEKQIIRKINTGDGFARNLINIFESMKALPRVRVKVDTASMAAELLFECQKSQPTNHEIQYAKAEHQSIIESLIVHLVLLKYLEREELAIFFESVKSSQKVIEFGAGPVNVPSFSMPISDPTLVRLLVEYLHKEIVPAPALRNLEKNDFRSDEELRFRRQQRATWSAISVSLFIGVVGLCIGYQSYSFEKMQARQSAENIDAIVTTIKHGFDSLDTSGVYLRSELERIADEFSRFGWIIGAVPDFQNENADGVGTEYEGNGLPDWGDHICCLRRTKPENRISRE